MGIDIPRLNPSYNAQTLKPETFLVQLQSHDLGRIAGANRVEFVLRQAERFHVSPNQTHRFDGIGEQRLAGVTGEREVLRPYGADRVVHDLRIDADQWRKFIEGEVEED